MRDRVRTHAGKLPCCGLIFCLIGQQSDMPCALDGAGKLALKTSADAGNARRQNLAARRQKALQQLNIFEINCQRRIRTERASLALCTPETTAST